MSHYSSDFLIQSERRKSEMAIAEQHRQLKEAQRAGLVIEPLVDLKRLNLAFLAVALAWSLAWLGSLFSEWSCEISSRYTRAIVANCGESQRASAD